MATIKSYKDLIAWQKSPELAKQVYSVTAGFPKSELYGIVSQVRRAAVSVATNIAEGQARNTVGEFKQFLGIAMGSLAELETLMILSLSFGYLTADQARALDALHSEVGRLINGLIRSLATRK